MQGFKKNSLLFLNRVVYPKTLLIFLSANNKTAKASYLFSEAQCSSFWCEKHQGEYMMIFSDILLHNLYVLLYLVLWKATNKHWKCVFLSATDTPTPLHRSAALTRWRGWCAPNLLENGFYRSAHGLVLMEQMLSWDSYGELFVEHLLMVDDGCGTWSRWGHAGSLKG